MAAAEAIRVCVDDFDFVVEDFSPVRQQILLYMDYIFFCVQD